MNIYKVLPSLDNERQMKFWYQGLRSQWSAADLDWKTPSRITSERMRDQLARVLTPVLTGEQSALYSVSGLIPVLGHRSEVESQFYLTTWAVDEARHTELFARFFGRIDREPMSIRRFPAGYLFQSRIISKDPSEWLTGVLASESMAQVISHELKELDLDPILSEMCSGILEDEARHLGFNHVYLEDQFRALYAKDRVTADAKAESLRKRMEYVLAGVPPIIDALLSEFKEVGIDMERVQHTLDRIAKDRLEKAISAGKAFVDKAAATTPANSGTELARS